MSLKQKLFGGTLILNFNRIYLPHAIQVPPIFHAVFVEETELSLWRIELDGFIS
jgi:hypothetical protein